jgi:hypothetical protein
MSSIVLLDDHEQHQSYTDTTVHNLTTNDDDDDGATSSSTDLNSSAQNKSRKEREMKGLKDLSDLLSQLDKTMADEKKHDENLSKKLARTKKAKPAPSSNGVNKGVGYGTCAVHSCGFMHASIFTCVHMHVNCGWVMCLYGWISILCVCQQAQAYVSLC